ncbi:uracil-DNA glycosylase [Methylopila jiangsuensis]|uniref:Uracil-DNA glycosylase n=1 Tax=Methylopila jiangsuensis TaxID=586230 RepID=A0A9W6N4T7_9HYPH|nr:uracil-DNA glycosylase family protein [Methylopila jiangsuensis]MDR6285066.1 uracil-DNA glycosylase [Methylopila jiangsuensis]GLK77547.1 uracil-DNA glycosylase [Methylopila jiangsuensis]
MLTGPLDCAASDAERLATLLAEIRACRICRDRPLRRPLPHEPRPVARASVSARLAVCGQAPGTRVHASGVPFSDPSGVRLRRWMGVTDDEFYDETRVAVLPMGFCFPGQDARGADLPPRRECAPAWRARLFEALPKVEMLLAIGRPAQLWHLGPDAGASLTEAVADWRRILDRPVRPRVLPLPHPSWRNNAWLRRNPWFEAELEPALRALTREMLDS